MGFARDLGAAATFGLSSTTKHKEAQKNFDSRRTLHLQRLNSYNETQAQLQASVDAMDSHFAAAQEVLLSTGALVPDANDNITYGWYKPHEEVEGVDNNHDYKRSSIGAIPAFGIGISTPAAIWTLVGIYGTASTGIAIGTLSGAAAGSATAAWIGRCRHHGNGRNDRRKNSAGADRSSRIVGHHAHRRSHRRKQGEELYQTDRRSDEENGPPGGNHLAVPEPDDATKAANHSNDGRPSKTREPNGNYDARHDGSPRDSEQNRR